MRFYSCHLFILKIIIVISCRKYLKNTQCFIIIIDKHKKKKTNIICLLLYRWIFIQFNKYILLFHSIYLTIYAYIHIIYVCIYWSFSFSHLNLLALIYFEWSTRFVEQQLSIVGQFPVGCSFKFAQVFSSE